MSARAVAAGMMLGLFISGFTFFNDVVIRQTFFVSNYVPVAVFGLAVVALLALNPLLNVFSDRAPMSGREIAITAAIAMAACAWPGFSFFRGFVVNTAMPSQIVKARPNWQAQQVMSYVPGGSAEVAAGHVTDWDSLARRLIGGDDAVSKRLRQAMTPQHRQAIVRAAADDHIDLAEIPKLLQALNAALMQPDLFDEQTLHDLPMDSEARRLLGERVRPELDPDEAIYLNRLTLSALLPGLIAPPPQGSGVITPAGAASEIIDPLVTGGQGGDGGGMLTAVPWRAWWPTIWRWGSFALLLALAAVCMALIVHPQWSRRELLAYPIPRFLGELADRDAGTALPRIARQRAFWIALAAVVALHLINGLHAWQPDLPAIPRTLNFQPLSELFPNARRVYGADRLFVAPVFLSVVAFAFFLPTSASFSLGVSQFAYVALGSLLLASGSSLEADYIGGGRGNMLRFGAYMGMAVMILYIGRRYYGQVLFGAIAPGRAVEEVPPYAVWAARGLAMAVILAVVVLRGAGLATPLASMFVGLVLLTFLVMTRIVAETGIFFIQPWWLPVGALTALLGIDAIGPTGYIVLALASTIVVGDPRTLLMPYLANGLKMVDDASTRGPAAGPRTASAPRSLTPWLLVMIVLGFAVSCVAAFVIQYNHGVAALDRWSRQTLPAMPFDALSQHLLELSGTGRLSAATVADAGERLAAISPDAEVLPWAIAGLALVVVAAGARLRFHWWPIHPVLFLVWGTYPAKEFAVSFLFGWAIKTAVVRTFGVSGFHMVLPIAVGVIAGELLASLAWIVFGAAYFFATNFPPQSYYVVP